MNINQNTKGNNNSSTINVFNPQVTVDLLPNEINDLLDYLSDEDNYIDESFGFTIPDLEKKT